jgi:hypothetical protein
MVGQQALERRRRGGGVAVGEGGVCLEQERPGCGIRAELIGHCGVVPRGGPVLAAPRELVSVRRDGPRVRGQAKGGHLRARGERQLVRVGGRVRRARRRRWLGDCHGGHDGHHGKR